MTTTYDQFTEYCKEGGSAFSLDIHEKLHEETTPYQTIAIYETVRYGTLMVIDGFTMVSDLDNFLYHEMMSHPMLFTHADPRRVLIIGGGDCGTLREVLRHQGVEKAQQVEIDERVTRLSEQYFPELCQANDDPRAELLFVDGIKWVQDAADGSYDIIIIDSTDPIGPAEGLFSLPFYRECYRALSSGGILVQQSESPLYHPHILQAMYRDFASAEFSSVATLMFPQPVYPSGWWSATMAGKGIDVRQFDRARAAAKPFATRYYNADIHQGALAMPEFFKREIAGQGSA